MLAYGRAADAGYEYLRIGENISLSCMHNFVEAIVISFGDEYLQKLEKYFYLQPLEKLAVQMSSMYNTSQYDSRRQTRWVHLL